LDEQRPDLLILTLRRDQQRSLSVCATVRKSEKWKDLPILFLSADPSPNMRLLAFAAGADDYLERPIASDELVTRIRQRVKREISRAEKYDSDSLTGLLLRRSLLERFASYLGQARRRHLPLGIGLIDLDGLKQVNDSHGHLAGDRVLGSLGHLLGARFRAEDLCCRWGGDEFVIALPGETAEVVTQILAAVRRDFERVEFSGATDQSFHASFSLGVACYPEDGSDFETLLGSADRSLYVAKNKKRFNRV
jgi:diguanylate cyclase (GGDEF)-like protein